NVSRADLLSSRRTANVVRPRQVAMYLAKTLTLRSLPEIGRRFGGRDHTTVLHAVRKIENLVGNDAMLADEIEVLKRQLQTWPTAAAQRRSHRRLGPQQFRRNRGGKQPFQPPQPLRKRRNRATFDPPWSTRNASGVRKREAETQA